MARVYSSTRLMLDPATIIAARNAGREQLAREAETRRGILSGISSLGGALGGVAGRALRQSEIGEVPEEADEEWKAAVERFVDTGDISGINLYKTRKAQEKLQEEQAKARKAETAAASLAAKTEAEKVDLEKRSMKAQEVDDAMRELQLAQNILETSPNARERKQAKINIEYNMKKLRRLGEDPSAFTHLLEEGATGAETTEGGASVGGEEKKGAETLSAQVRRFTERFARGFKTKKEKADFLGELETLIKENPQAAEMSEFSDLLMKARKTTDKESAGEAAAEQERKDAEEWAKMRPAERVLLISTDQKKAERLEKAFNKLNK